MMNGEQTLGDMCLYLKSGALGEIRTHGLCLCRNGAAYRLPVILLKNLGNVVPCPFAQSALMAVIALSWGFRSSATSSSEANRQSFV